MRMQFIGLLVALALVGCASDKGAAPTSNPSDFHLNSDDFEEGDEIPQVNTCDGKGDSPHLAWENPPRGTQSFALIVDDPDAPMGTFVHWVLYNIPPDVTYLPAVLPGLAGGAHTGEHGVNGAGTQAYIGPCPPSGTHHYYFKLYALDNLLDLGSPPKAGELVAAMQGHVLGQAVLLGTYKRK